MIRKLGNEDKEALKNYLRANLLHSVYILSAIDSYAFDDEAFSCFADCDEKGRYNFTFFKQFDTLNVYSNNGKADAYAIERYLKENGLRYTSAVMDTALFEQYQKAAAFKEAFIQTVCLLESGDFKQSPHAAVTQKAVPKDLDEITALRASIEEFEGFLLHPSGVLKYIQAGNVRYIKEKGRIVSMASCSVAEGIANVGGVCTHKDFRCRGYASKVVSDLSAIQLEKGSTCRLTYDNPEAGKIYLKLGYREAGQSVLALK